MGGNSKQFLVDKKFLVFGTPTLFAGLGTVRFFLFSESEIRLQGSSFSDSGRGEAENSSGTQNVKSSTTTSNNGNFVCKRV